MYKRYTDVLFLLGMHGICSSYIDNEKTLSDFNQSVAQENEEMSAVNSLTGWPHKKMKIWMTLDHPRSSRLAMVRSVIQQTRDIGAMLF